MAAAGIVKEDARLIPSSSGLPRHLYGQMQRSKRISTQRHLIHARILGQSEASLRHLHLWRNNLPSKGRYISA